MLQKQSHICVDCPFNPILIISLQLFSEGRMWGQNLGIINTSYTAVVCSGNESALLRWIWNFFREKKNWILNNWLPSLYNLWGSYRFKYTSIIKTFPLGHVSHLFICLSVFRGVHPLLFSPGILFLVNALCLWVYESLDFKTSDSQEDMKFDKNIHTSLLFVKDTANFSI